MKKTLAFDPKRGQFRADIGTPSRRLYLGPDASMAQARKVQLVDLWARSGATEWTEDLKAQAEAIRKGEAVQLRRKTGEDQAAYLKREEAVVRSLPASVQVTPAITESDLAIS